MEPRGSIELLNSGKSRRLMGLRRPLRLLDHEAVWRRCLHQGTSELFGNAGRHKLTTGGGTMIERRCPDLARLGLLMPA
jgi:hypothetical protein